MRRSSIRWIATVLLLIVFVGSLAYGIYVGDAAYVFKNAAEFCFT